MWYFPHHSLNFPILFSLCSVFHSWNPFFLVAPVIDYQRQSRLLSFSYLFFPTWSFLQMFAHAESFQVLPTSVFSTETCFFLELGDDTSDNMMLWYFFCYCPSCVWKKLSRWILFWWISNMQVASLVSLQSITDKYVLLFHFNCFMQFSRLAICFM